MFTALTIAALALPVTLSYAVFELIDRAALRRLDTAMRGPQIR